MIGARVLSCDCPDRHFRDDGLTKGESIVPYSSASGAIGLRETGKSDII